MLNLKSRVYKFFLWAKPTRRIILLFIIYYLPLIRLEAQKENNMWYMGVNTVDKNALDTGLNQLFGATVLNFNLTPYTISRQPKTATLTGNVVNMCDSSGKLLFYCNGSKVFNTSHELVQNGDSLNYSKYWTLGDEGYFGNYIIGIAAQSMLCIPHPYIPNQYYLVATYLDWGRFDTFDDQRAFIKIMYSLLDMSLNGGKGKLIIKEKVLATGNFAQGVFGCKKSNGRDWWILIRNIDSTGCFTKISIDNKGIYAHPIKQCLGYKLYSKVQNDSLYAFSSGNFSPDGKKFAFSSWNGLEVFNFDRCTGNLSNPKLCNYPFGDTILSKFAMSGLSFSPSNEFIYVADAGTQDNKNMYRLFQFETNASNLQSSMVRVARYDGFADHLNGDTTLVGFQTGFSSIQIAPNNKIYIGNAEPARYLHEIEFPDKKGLACNVKQHRIVLPTYVGAPPYYPSYNLGTEFCCDYGSSISANDTNLWTLDTGTYQWLYCDSNNKPIPNATQSSYKPKKSGNYAVRISNSLCTDTTDCKYIQVKSSISDVSMAAIEIYPNPAKDMVCLESNIKGLMVEIYDILGRCVHKVEVTNVVNIKELTVGVYILKIFQENNGEIHQEKLIIQR